MHRQIQSLRRCHQKLRLREQSQIIDPLLDAACLECREIHVGGNVLLARRFIR